MPEAHEGKRIVIVDDHPIVRDGLKQMIEQASGIRVCGEASNADEALRVVKELKPDLVLVDVFLDGINGIELTKLLCEKHPSIRVLVLSMHDESLYAERAIRAGARGYVMKQEASLTILNAMTKVLEGGVYVSDAVRTTISDIEPGRFNLDPETIRRQLSSRELAVFEAIGQGLDRPDIADALDISIKTVETHRSNIKYKLNMPSALALTESAKAWVKSKG